MKFKVMLCAACLGLTMESSALTLPEGIEVEPPSSLDLTYQVLPFYDEKEKVLARWDGDNLQFFVTIQTLSPEYTDPDAYIRDVVRDLKSAWGSVDVGRTATYPGVQNFNGTALEVSKPATGDEPSIPLVMHFITDGKRAYVATVTTAGGASITQDQLLQESADLLRTVHPTPDGKPVPAKVFEGSELVGNWGMEEKQPDGELVVAQIRLNPDYSFASNISVDGKQVFSATGLWHRTGNEMYWTYLYSAPQLPQSVKEDVDQILSTEPDQIVFKSNLSGKQRTMTRLPQ